MNTKTVLELRSIANDKGLHGFYKLKKVDLLAFLIGQSLKKCQRHHREIISSPQEMDEFEKEEMKKSRPVVKRKLNEWYDWLLVDYVPKPIKNAVSKAFSRAKNSILGLYDGAKKTLKDIVEKEGGEEEQ